MPSWMMRLWLRSWSLAARSSHRKSVAPREEGRNSTSMRGSTEARAAQRNGLTSATGTSGLM